MKKTKRNNKGWYFLGIIVLIYILLMIIEPDKAVSSLNFALKIFNKVLPIFIIVFLLMVIINIFVEPSHVHKYLGRASGIKGWLFSIISGIISTGPVYMWYPILKQLKMNGARIALISVFLYNRSVKLPLLPLLIMYFGLKYTIVLTVFIIILSPLQGWLVEKIAK